MPEPALTGDPSGPLLTPSPLDTERLLPRFRDRPRRLRQTLRACATPGCPELTTAGHCDTHTSQLRSAADDKRGSFRERGYDADYDRNRATVIAEETHCWLCGDPVDKNRRGPDPLSASADHIIRREDGGTNKRDNLRLAHLGCNSARGAQTRGTTTRPERQGPLGSVARPMYGSQSLR